MFRLSQFFLSLSMFFLATLNSQSALAQEEEDIRDAYFGIGYTRFEFKNLPDDPRDNWTSGTHFILGTYITEYVRAEIRVGYGLDDEKVSVARVDRNGDVVRVDEMTVSVNKYYSGYFGGEYPATDYLAVYGLVGITHFDGEVKDRSTQAFPDIPDTLIDSSFGVSYVLGAHVRIIENFRAYMDYGRLHTDTATDIDTQQWNMGVSYAF